MASRAARTVCREIAQMLPEHISPMDSRPIHLGTLLRWKLLLAPPPRKKRPRDVPRSARRATVKELDALCREVVFLRERGACRWCGKPAVDWSHVYSRRYKWLRWDLDNSFASCKGCHLRWHHRPMEGAEFWRKAIGPTVYQSLVLRAGKPQKADPVKWKMYLEQEKRRLS